MREILGKLRRLGSVVASFWIATATWAQGVIPPSSVPPRQSQVTISVDLSRNVVPFLPIYSWFGYDEANYTTTPLGRALLGELRDLSPQALHIRVHHLLTSGSGKPELKFSSTNVYHEDAKGHPVYDFTILDGIFDTYRAESIRPVVELGFMPKDLAANLPNRPSQPYQVHFPHDPTSGASNNPPKDYRRWGELVRAVTAHLVQRYGRAAVQQWHFEVWNEPDIGYWHGSEADYFRLYDYAVAGVRAALPAAHVGGPATTGPSDAHAAAFLQAFLDHVKTGKSAATGGKVPLDFISFHAKGRPTIANGQVTMGLARELTDVDRGFTIIESYPMFRHLPVILSEADPEGCAACSSRMDPSNNYRNGTLYPAYTAAAFKGLLDLARVHRTNLIAMLSWSFEFENQDYFAGFRSLSTNGIDKPILNLFRMLGLMGGERIAVTSSASVPLATLVKAGVRTAPDVDALATREGRQVAVLVWNYHDAAATAAATPEATVTVKVQGIPTGVRRVLVQNYRIDDTHSNAYTAWQAMGSPQQPTTGQYARLKADEGVQLLDSPTWMEVKSGTIEAKTVMPRESVSLLSLRW